MNHVDNATVVDAAVSDRSAAALFEEGSTSSMGRLSPAAIEECAELLAWFPRSKSKIEPEHELRSENGEV
jgi:hypothetical protein